MEVSRHVRSIMTFVEAADNGSFAATARQLGISAAAVSKNIAGLEQVLGVRLLNRTTRRVTLTEEGAAFLGQARVALNALENAVDTIAAGKQETSGHVRISTSASFGREHVIPALPGLMARYPALTLEVDFDDRITDLIHDGYDLTIRGGRIVDSSLISRPVCRMNTILVASPDYLSSHGEPKHPEALKNHKLIARRFLRGRVSPWGFRDQDGSFSTFDPEPAALTLSAPEALVEAACMGIGIAEVGVHTALKKLISGELKIVMFEQHDPGNYEMVIQYPHRALIAPRVRVTIEYLLEAFSKDSNLTFPYGDLVSFTY
ncbi:LysR family transcriptional regulator [Dickeya fangzhongdai]|uniref:LysR family transcriptional regulator n=1 Tax=Dickeya fangzhongdai TaxID=1778540 RepID=UPI0004F753A0|nr:LysR family transcriptional regulator [Dickeya fangzhongdai]AIR70951.1 transcriptional regulator [Dickeya fangzhongdai]KGT97141.1 transcriptional regulator [Dickeya fangzhongdai]